MELELTRDVLDLLLVDRNETKMGRVDGLVFIVHDDGPPVVDRLELGFVVLASRLHPRLERWVEAIRKRFSVRKTARQQIPWSAVAEIKKQHIKLSIDAVHTPAFDWERWLRDHIVSKIPGSSPE